MSVHPPRPRLVLRVGITGHRWNKLKLEHRDALRGQVREVLGVLQELASRLAREPGSGYRRPDPGSPDEPRQPEFRLISALAEGADRIPVEAAPPGWRLQAILPFPVDVYQQDFTEPNSLQTLQSYLERARTEAGVLILDGDREAPNAFEPVGTAVCLNSDVLLAIWNEQPGQRGGTEGVVGLAIRMGIPIIRIAPDGSEAPWLDRAEYPDRGRSEGLQQLEDWLRRLLLPPLPPADADEEELHEWKRMDLREVYFRERHRPWRRGQLYGFALRVLAFRWRHPRDSWREIRGGGLPLPRRSPEHYGEAIRRRWTENWKRRLGIAGECVDPLLDSRLPDHYGWASHLASYYAGRYRNAFSLGYLFSSIAVGFGAAGGLATSALLLWVPRSTVITAGVEVALLLSILYVVASARRGRFQERWLAYRSLTEGFRSLSYTLPFARASTLDASGGPGREHWGDWLHRAVVREVGIPSAVMTDAHLREARKLLLDDLLSDQIAYHGRNATTLSQVHRRLHRWSTALFFLAIFIALWHLYDGIEHLMSREGLHLEKLTLALGVLAITIPAATAAAQGFLSQGEFEASAERSRQTRRALERLQQRGSVLPVTSTALGDLAGEAARAMDSELGAWFAAYSSKDVNYS